MPCSFDERVQQLKEAQRGWVHYFRLANIQGKLKEVDSWIRNRLRHCIWHDWKRPERKRKNLIRMGVPKGQAYAWSRTRKGGWAVAHSPMLITTVTVKRLAKRGYESLIDYYRKVAPQLNEPLYARPACTVVVCHERRTLIVLRCCANDEGRPLGAGIQVQAPNRLVRLCLKGMVVSDKEKLPER